MKKALLDLLASKKTLVALLSILVWVLGRIGLDLTVDELLPIVAPIWGLLAGISAEDLGKAGKKIEAGRE